MDSNEVNKLLAGLLGTVFVVFSVGLVSNALFASPPPEKPGFAIEAAEPAEGGPAAPAAEDNGISVENAPEERRGAKPAPSAEAPAGKGAKGGSVSTPAQNSAEGKGATHAAPGGSNGGKK